MQSTHFLFIGMSFERRKYRRLVAVDLFCGAGGLTRGLLDSGIKVVAGYDVDSACAYPYNHNNKPAKFYKVDVSRISSADLEKHYPPTSRKILVGCAPCQPFSKYRQGIDNKADPKWKLLNHFARLATDLKPEIVSMENVPELQRHSIHDAFAAKLEAAGYTYSAYEVYGPDYGLPQQRTRLVAFASIHGQVKLPEPTHSSSNPPKARDTIDGLPVLGAGGVSEGDLLHRCSRLSPINLLRIKHSQPGGTWRDWPEELIANCHRKPSGRSYPGVYGRFDWDKPAPTVTTQFYGFGNGRFGHPEQDRALSLREGALLQGFPPNYEFVSPTEEISMKHVGRLIGNAVPVTLGQLVGQAIRNHLRGN